MRRSLMLVVAMTAIVAVAVPAFAASRISVPKEFRSVLPRVKSRSDIPVRLPQRITSPRTADETFGSVEGLRDGRYHLSLGVGRGCNESPACFVAAFYGRRGKAPNPDFRRVELAQGIIGRYRPLKCGASCAAAIIQWRQTGVAYEIQYKGTRRQMIRLANSAINSGPR